MTGARRKWLLVAGAGLFFLVAVMAVVANAGSPSLIENRGLLGSSISRYVAAAGWTAVVFGVVNIFAAVVMCRELWRMGEKLGMPKGFFWLVLVLGVTLVTLSLCPVGWGDINGQKSLTTCVHELSSRTMFSVMLVMAILLAVRKASGQRMRGYAALYAVYGVVCVLGYLMKWEWFLNLLFVFEMLYIILFVGMLLIYNDE